MAVWSVVKLSALPRLRLDAEYYQPRYLRLIKYLESKSTVRLDQLAYITDGIHGSPDVVEDGGVQYLSAKSVKNNHFSLGDTLQISKTQDAQNKRTRLKVGDVLLTTVGTIGNAAVVTDDIVPSNIDRHLGLIRLNDNSDFDPYYISTFLNSRFGKLQTLRESTGNVQLNLFIEKIKELKILVLPSRKRVANLTRQAYEKLAESKTYYDHAESLLIAELGVANLSLSHRLFYERNYSEANSAHRLDAEFFQPRYQRLFSTLRKQNLTLGEIVNLRKEYFRPRAGKSFQYIEIGDISSDGTAESDKVMGENAPSRATWVVRAGDIITSLVRPIRRLSALIQLDQERYVCSSGFAVLQPHNITSEVLLVYLRLPIIAEVMNLYTTASMYPAISTAELMRLPVSLPSPRTSELIKREIVRSRAAREESTRLLQEAEMLVERELLGGIE